MLQMIPSQCLGCVISQEDEREWGLFCSVHLTPVPVLIRQTINTQGFLSKLKMTFNPELIVVPDKLLGLSLYILHLQSCFKFSRCHQEAPGMQGGQCVVCILCYVWMIQWLTPPNHFQLLYSGPLHSLGPFYRHESPRGVTRQYLAILAQQIELQTNMAWCVA